MRVDIGTCLTNNVFVGRTKKKNRNFLTYLSIHGIKVELRSYLPSVTKDLVHDFAYFVRKACGGSDFTIRLEPRSARSGRWVRVLRGPRSQIYFAPPGERRVCFFGRAWVRYRFEAGECEIFCDDAEIAYEVVYLVLLSFAGERLDSDHLHRIHGLGVTIGDRGALVLAPSGTGKSTLAVRLLRNPEVRILSDDTPLVGAGARMVAFPQRIALKENPRFAGKHVRKFKRVEYGEKFVVGASYFRKQIADDARVQWLLVAKRRGDTHPNFEAIGKLHLIWPLVKWLVLGLETPQVWELMIRPSAKDCIRKLSILGLRARSGWDLLRHCRTGVVYFSENPDESSQFFESYFS